MKRIFRAQKMLDRIKREGLEHLLDDSCKELMEKLDGKEGDYYNWASTVCGEDVVWIPADGDRAGAFVAACDCD